MFDNNDTPWPYPQFHTMPVISQQTYGHGYCTVLSYP